MQFEVLEKFTSAYLFQIAREKSCDYLLIIHMQKFHSVFLFNRVYFVPGPAYIHVIGWKMTSLIDMQAGDYYFKNTYKGLF